MELNAFCNVFSRKILMPKLYDQNQNLADVVSILRDAIATLHQPNPGPVLAHCSMYCGYIYSLTFGHGLFLTIQNIWYPFKFCERNHIKWCCPLIKKNVGLHLWKCKKNTCMNSSMRLIVSIFGGENVPQHLYTNIQNLPTFHGAFLISEMYMR